MADDSEKVFVESSTGVDLSARLGLMVRGLMVSMLYSHSTQGEAAHPPGNRLGKI